MSYNKLGFTSGQTLMAEHLNHMEEGIANAGVRSYNDLPDKPFWIERKKAPLLPWLDEPITITVETINEGGFNMAQGDFDVVLGYTNYVVFDGVEYECEPCYEESGETYIIGSFDFSKHPFFIFDGGIITQTAGTHTVMQYVYVPEVKTEYCPHLFIKTMRDEDRKPYLKMEDVEKIKDAYGKGVPISVSTNHGGLGVNAQVTGCTSDLISIAGIYDRGNGLICNFSYGFLVRDGSLYNSAYSIYGTIMENGSNYPVMTIANREYKITVDDGKLIATEI